MTPLLSLVLALSPAWAASVATTSLDVKIGKAPGDFLRNVGRQCLSAPQSKIALGRGSVRIEDEPRCAAELKTAAGAWEANVERGVMAGHVPAEHRDEVKKTLSERFPADQSRLLIDTPHCPCLVFAGPKSTDAARLAAALGSRNLR